MQDGTLLKPSWPAVPIDEYYTQRAFGRGEPRGELTYTYSSVPFKLVDEQGKGEILTSRNMMSVLAIDLLQDYSLDLVTIPELDHEARTVLAYKY